MLHRVRASTTPRSPAALLALVSLSMAMQATAAVTALSQANRSLSATSLSATRLDAPTPGQNCTPGIFRDAKQWRSLFRGDMKLKGKALVVSPVGRSSARMIDKMVTALGFSNFEFLFITYDNHTWGKYPWHDRVKYWRKQEPGATNWAAIRHFATPQLVQKGRYTHVLKYDDDMLPTQYFDAGVMLQWLQHLDLGISQPAIRRHYHKPFSWLKFDPASAITEGGACEVMVPMYSAKVWSECLWPNLIPGETTGWGIGKYIHQCSCNGALANYVIHLPLDHADTKSLGKRNALGDAGLKQYCERWKDQKTTTCGKAQEAKRGSYDVAVDGNCAIKMVKRQKQPPGPYKTLRDDGPNCEIKATLGSRAVQ